MKSFKTADAAQPWCSKCAKHTEGREKILDLLGGSSGSHLGGNGGGRCRSYRCNECGKTMWAPVDCKNAGWQGMIIVLFGVTCMIASVFALLLSSDNLFLYMAIVEGLVVCYVYQRCWKKNSTGSSLKIGLSARSPSTGLSSHSITVQ